MYKKKRKKFLRRNWDKYSRLGLRRKKLQKWRRPRGTHSKMRKRRKGYPGRPEVGMRKAKVTRKEIILVRNMRDLSKQKKGAEVVLSKVGKRKRKEMENKAKEMGIKILNERKIAIWMSGK